MESSHGICDEESRCEQTHLVNFTIKLDHLGGLHEFLLKGTPHPLPVFPLSATQSGLSAHPSLKKNPTTHSKERAAEKAVRRHVHKGEEKPALTE